MIGIIQLANRPLTVPGCVAGPGTFAYPVRFATAEGAWVDRVVAGDPELAGPYVDAGRALLAGGVRGVACSCGFAIAYQRALSAALPVPVVSSSLLLLPHLLAMVGSSALVGVLTFEAAQLTSRHLTWAGVRERDERRLTIAGIDGTASWRALREPDPEPDLEQLAADVIAATERLADGGGRVAAVLVECSAFLPFTAAVRERLEIPVLDLVDAVDLMAAALGSSPRPATGS
jgi:hypothetical protein